MAISFAVFIGWIVLLVIWALFWAPTFSLTQNILVVVGVVGGGFVILGIAWMPFYRQGGGPKR